MHVDKLILLDVDGVLAPFGRPGPQWQAHRLTCQGETYNVLLNPEHGPVLLELAETVGADLVWATMWSHDANAHIAPLLGLPQLPVIDMREAVEPGDDYRVHRKTPMVAEFVQGRPFVWFDDELTRRDKVWLKAHPGVGDFRLIHTGWQHGVSAKHFAQAREWFRVESATVA